MTADRLDLDALEARIVRSVEVQSAYGYSADEARVEVSPSDLHALIAAAREAEMMRPNYEGVPCDGGCSYNDGPQEERSLHGRTPADLWQMLTAAEAERDAAQAALARVTSLHYGDPYAQGPDYCAECEHRWPCDTIRGLRDQGQEAGD